MCESKVCVCVYKLSVHVCERVFIFFALPLAFLMQHRTVSPGLLGDLVMFFFFLSSQETRTNCCAVAIGAGRFVFSPLSSLVPPRRQLPQKQDQLQLYFHPCLLPSMIYRCFLFFNPLHSTYLPALQQPVKYLENCGTSLKRIHIKAGTKSCRSKCRCTACTVTPELLSSMPMR